MKQWNNKAIKSGQALIEAIVALSALIIGFVAILALLNNSLALNQNNINQNIATYLAVEGIEVAKNLIDANVLKGNDFNFQFIVGSYEVNYFDVLDDGPPSGDNKNPGKRIGGVGSESSRPLLYDSVAGYHYGNGVPTKFFRTVKVLPPPDPGPPPAPREDFLHIQSIVKWTTRGGASSEVIMEDYFFEPQP